MMYTELNLRFRKDKIDKVRIYKLIENNESLDNANDNWMIILSDLLSLLLSFFLVIYLQSSPSQEIIREIASSVRMHYHLKDLMFVESPFKKNESIKNALKPSRINYIEQVLKHKFLNNPNLNNLEIEKHEDSVKIIFHNHEIFAKNNSVLSEDGKRILYNIYSELLHIDAKLLLSHTISTRKTDNEIKNLYEKLNIIVKYLNNLGFKTSIDIQIVNSLKHNKSDLIEFFVKDAEN